MKVKHLLLPEPLSKPRFGFVPPLTSGGISEIYDVSCWPGFQELKKNLKKWNISEDQSFLMAQEVGALVCSSYFWRRIIRLLFGRFR